MIACAGVAITIIGFAKTIEPVIEVGVALIVVAMITESKPKP
jgi:uncharacterized membrane protein